jgi:hypothetical protein
MIETYMKLICKFNGDRNTSIEDHDFALQYCIDNLVIDHEDVYLRIYVQSLEGDAIKWFKNLPIETIVSLETFHRIVVENGKKK